MYDLKAAIDALSDNERSKAIARLSKSDMMDTLSIVNDLSGLGLSIKQEGKGYSVYTLYKGEYALASCQRSIEMFRILEGMLVMITIENEERK